MLQFKIQGVCYKFESTTNWIHTAIDSNLFLTYILHVRDGF